MTNKWLMAICAVAIHISIGSIYAWSQLSATIEKTLNTDWSLSQITLTFSIAIISLGVATLFMGRFVEKYGPRSSGIVAALFFSIGLILGGIALKNEQLWLLYIGYGVLGGIGIGIGYITPVSTLLAWFPQRRGFAMGLAIMGFGFGAMLEIFLIQDVFPMLGIINISSMLIALGISYGLLMLIASLFLTLPEQIEEETNKNESCRCHRT